MPDEVLAEAAVAAVGCISLPLTEVEALRTNPGATRPQVAKTLRNAEEQTVVAAVALARAVESRGWQDKSFADWGVIGCPRFLGRMIITSTIVRFFEDPKFSISPHIIPNFSLHSPSGTVSVGFGMRGSNFGVGGGPRGVPEGLLTALSVMVEDRLPGLWLLLSEFDPEPRPDRAGKATNAANVHSVALALTSADDHGGRLRLVRTLSASSEKVPTVHELVQALNAGAESTIRCPVEGLGIIEFERGPAR
jgi:hypothetical protein